MISWVCGCDGQVMGVVYDDIHQWLLGSCVKFKHSSHGVRLLRFSVCGSKFLTSHPLTERLMRQSRNGFNFAASAASSWSLGRCDRLGSECIIRANQITSVGFSVYLSPNASNNSTDLFCVE